MQGHLENTQKVTFEQHLTSEVGFTALLYRWSKNK
jgi:hypothetical protein